MKKLLYCDMCAAGAEYKVLELEFRSPDPLRRTRYSCGYHLRESVDNALIFENEIEHGVAVRRIK
jgi:hypothetical protein